MFADAIIRYIPQTEQILNLDFNFHDFPLFPLILTLWKILFSGQLLFLMWKTTSFIFFIAILLLLPSLFKRFQLNNGERIIVMALFFFSAWSLLLSTTVMQEMMLTFFAISLFLVIEKYFEKPDKKTIFLTILLSFLICLTKATALIILSGFFLYILIKKKENFIKKKINLILYSLIGIMVSLFWPIKNYFMFGDPFVSVELNSIALHSFSEYWTFFVRTYHYFWEFPLAEKVALTGNLASLFNVYHITTIIITALISLFLIISTIKYCKKHKEFIGLLAPIFLFSLIYWPFIILWSESDSGRYTFPLWIFIFIFTVKTLFSINSKSIRRIITVLIALFCLVLTISAFGIAIQMNSMDNQIQNISERLERENLENAVLVSNNEFAAAALTYYLGKQVQFNMKKNIIDPNVKCYGDKIFESNNFNVFKEEKKYRICRK